MKSYITIPSNVIDLVTEIANMNEHYEVYLGGGYLRDLYCGVTPKDIDIFFSPKKYQPELAVEFDFLNIIPLEKYPDTCKKLYRKSVNNSNFNQDMANRGIRSLVGLMALNDVLPNQIQIITYNQIMTHNEVTLDLDMNICQISWHPLTNTFDYSDSFLNGHSDRIIKCLHDYDPIRMWHRYSRMEEKYPNYTVEGKNDIDDIDKVQLSSGKNYKDSV
jgi:hypothetical protein